MRDATPSDRRRADSGRAGRRRRLAALLAAGSILAGFAALPARARTAGTADAASTAATLGTLELATGWALAPAANVTDGGAALSQPGHALPGGYPVTLPSTVLAGLVANGFHTNLYEDTNLQGVPDLTTQDWWYRGEFVAPAAGPDQRYRLRFEGIAYRARIWLNGALLDSNAVGTLVQHEYDVTGLLNAGGANALALQVTPPGSAGRDLSFWYVDWNPQPPDMNAGIWGRVVLEATGPVALRDPYVRSALPLPSTSSADLTVFVDAVNGSASPVTGVLGGRISKPGHPTLTFEQVVALGAHERREIAFDPGAFPQLHLEQPALWWPRPLGAAERYDLQLAFTVAGQPSDSASLRFGVRQVTEYITPPVHGRAYRGYRVNGQNVLVRGADYVWDLLLRTPPEVNATHMGYAGDLGLNLVRFEGILGNEALYDLADEQGILMMAGFVCCSYWSEVEAWTPEDRAVADASLECQMRRLRAHPGAFVWAYGSDELHPPAIRNAWKAIAAGLHWQNPTLDNLASFNNTLGGVPKMEGPYAWEPPVYWYADTTRGGAFGFCAEQGGESVPPRETLERFLSPANRWPIGAAYGYHSGPAPFDNLDWYVQALVARYGAPADLDAFAQRAQLMNYESVRAQFEAYAARAHTQAYGTVYWMLNNAWPSVHWHLYDYYGKPGGGYFGAKKALEPVHILYEYDTRTVKVFNGTRAPLVNARAVATVHGVPDLALHHAQEQFLTAAANAATTAFTLPAPTGLPATYLVRLRLEDAAGRTVSENLYWYSTSPDVPGSGGDWYYTDVSAYADLTGLNALAANDSVRATAVRIPSGDSTSVEITLRNTSRTRLAFFLRPEVTAGPSGREVTPITYSDNHVTIFPGDSLVLLARFATSDLGGESPALRVRGYNVPEAAGLVLNVPELGGEPADRLGSIAPNPFRAQATVTFDLAQRGRVRLAVFDVSGRLVRRLVDRAVMEPGRHSVAWNATDDGGRPVRPGLYFCRLESPRRAMVRRVALVR